MPSKRRSTNRKPAPRARAVGGIAGAAAGELLRLAVEASPAGMLMIDQSGKIVLVNSQTEKLFGYARADLIGETLEILLPARFRKAHVGHREGFLARPETRSMGAGRELFGRRKDGGEIPVEIGLNPIETAAGRFVLASVIDISERKKAEDRFRLAVEAAPNGMLMVGRGGEIVLVNSQAEKLFGYAREELIGKTMETLVPPRFRKGHPGHRADFFARPETRSMGAGRDLFALRKDGTEFPVEIGLNPIRTAEGDFVLASIIDITQRRAMEKKLAHSEVLASIGSMASVVAHEIRNPLGSIVMAAKAAAHSDLSAEEREQVLDVLRKESERLNRTLTDFLEFSKPREPRLEPGDLNDAAREILTVLKSDANVVGKTRIKETWEESLPRVLFDADLMRQVLWNVMRNAFQALEGKGVVEIRTEALPDAVAVHVQDDGPGIPLERLEKIFMPFFTTKAKGTGLGLPTSRNIIHAHGGEIRVESAPGRGSRFTILLPRRAAR